MRLYIGDRMETGIEINDLQHITTRNEINGLHVKNLENKDRFISILDFLNGMLFPDESSNIDLAGIGLLNIRELTVSGLVDLMPYIQGDINRTKENPVLPTTPNTLFNDNVFDSDFAEFTKKGIVINKAIGQADENMISFQRAGYYKIMCNVERKLRTNKSQAEFNITGADDWLNIGKYQYDSGGDTVTINNRFSVREKSLIGPPFTDITTTHIRKKESEEFELVTNELTRNFQFEFDVFISDPVTDRVKLEFMSLNEDNPILSVNDATLYIDYNYAISVNAWR